MLKMSGDQIFIFRVWSRVFTHEIMRTSHGAVAGGQGRKCGDTSKPVLTTGRALLMTSPTHSCWVSHCLTWLMILRSGWQGLQFDIIHNLLSISTLSISVTLTALCSPKHCNVPNKNPCCQEWLSSSPTWPCCWCRASRSSSWSSHWASGRARDLWRSSVAWPPLRRVSATEC